MSERFIPASGHCLCGAVSFSCEVDTTSTMICHCTECQIMGSAAFRIGAFTKGDQLSLVGEVREYSRDACIGARNNVFCPNCGTVLCSYTPDSPTPRFVLSVGVLDERELFLPKFQINGDQALVWTSQIADIPVATAKDLAG